jgi:tetratricopeptide (TPR) repeat protein
MASSFQIRFLVYGLVIVYIAIGCGVAQMAEVSPSEIPELEANLVEDPHNGDLVLRYAAALFSAGQYDSAIVIAERGRDLRPGNTLGPLVIGQCLEEAGRFEEALAGIVNLVGPG